MYCDESGVTTSLTRLYGRSQGGERIREGTPGGRWEVLTLLGALSLRGVQALMTIASPTDGDIFLAFVDRVLGPTLRPDDVVGIKASHSGQLWKIAQALTEQAVAGL